MFDRTVMLEAYARDDCPGRCPVQPLTGGGRRLVPTTEYGLSPCNCPPVMSSSIYTLGYAHWSAAEVERRLHDLDAWLADVRHSPHTTKPGFSKPELADRLGPRYAHVPEFGNVNYKDGPVELAAPDDGIDRIRTGGLPVVLMCGCASPAACHRQTVAELLCHRMGGTPTHLRAPDDGAQPDLFDDE